MAKYSIEVINQAKDLFLQNFSFRKIAEQLHIKRHLTVFSWSKKYNWKQKRPSYPINSLKEQLDQCTAIVEKLRSDVEKANILEPSKKERELLLNYNRFSNLQLKLVRQLSVLKPLSGNTAKKSIFD